MLLAILSLLLLGTIGLIRIQAHAARVPVRVSSDRKAATDTPASWPVN